MQVNDGIDGSFDALNSLAGEYLAGHNATVNRTDQTALIERLKQATAARGMKRQAARAMNVTPQRLSNILADPEQNFTQTTLSAIEAWLESVTSPDIVAGDDTRPDPHKEAAAVSSPSKTRFQVAAADLAEYCSGEELDRATDLIHDFIHAVRTERRAREAATRAEDD